MRKAARTCRARLASEANGAAERAAEHFLAAFAPLAGTVVSAYWPLPEEFDTRPLLVKLQARGCVVALPVVVERGQPLRFRRWQAGDLLRAGPLGVSEPPAGALEVVPRVLVVPLLAFDDTGCRLGYGGGFYDRTLRLLRGQMPPPLAVGYAYAGQEVARLPRGPGDESLDALVHEAGVRRFERTRTP